MSTGCLDCGAQRHRLHTPYEYKSFMVPAAEVKALVQQRAGATLQSPTACP